MSATAEIMEAIEKFGSEHGFTPTRLWVSPSRYLWLQKIFEAMVLTPPEETGWICRIAGVEVCARGAIEDDYAILEGTEPHEQLWARHRDTLGLKPTGSVGLMKMNFTEPLP